MKPRPVSLRKSNTSPRDKFIKGGNELSSTPKAARSTQARCILDSAAKVKGATPSFNGRIRRQSAIEGHFGCQTRVEKQLDAANREGMRCKPTNCGNEPESPDLKGKIQAINSVLNESL
jgi:hypothetical protein